jgi:hypothetical protein
MTYRSSAASAPLKTYRIICPDNVEGRRQRAAQVIGSRARCAGDAIEAAIDECKLLHLLSAVMEVSESFARERGSTTVTIFKEEAPPRR